MESFIIEMMNDFGYLGIAFLIMIENIFPPIPSEVILAFGGFMTTYSSMNMFGVIIVSTIGSMIGAVVLYGLGRCIKPAYLETLLDSKLAHILRFKKEDVAKAKGWFEKRGNYTVFFCRFVPIVRSLISIPAGIAQMNFVSFLVLTLIGSAIWNSVLVYAGATAGNNWGNIVAFMNEYSHYALIALVIIFVVFVIYHFLNKKNKAS